jgi:hypothetical protein
MTDSSIEDIPPPPTQPRKPTRLTTPINSNVLRRLAREDADVMFADADTEDSDSSDVVDITDDIDVVDVDDSVSIIKQPAIKREADDVRMEDSRSGVKKKGSRTTSLVLFY